MRIEIGVTHEIMINGDKAWVKLGITDDVEGASADIDVAIRQLSDKVNKKIIEVIENTVHTVENYEVNK